MADGTYYAWTPILTGVERDKNDPSLILKRNMLPYGSAVTKDDLGIESDEDWNALLEGGAVRNYAPPELPAGYNGSPVEFLRDQAKKAEESSLTMIGNIGGYNVGGPDEAELFIKGPEQAFDDAQAALEEAAANADTTGDKNASVGGTSAKAANK